MHLQKHRRNKIKNKKSTLIFVLQNSGTKLSFPRFLSDLCWAWHVKMAEQEESVRGFVAVTDVDEERARFFLESAGWDLQVSGTLITLSLKYYAVKHKHCSRGFSRL